MKANYNNKQKKLLRKPKESIQPIDFTEIVYGKISPSDIDAIIEIDDTYLIIIEVKKFGNPLSTGQALLIKRLVNAWNADPNKEAIGIFATHSHYDAEESILLKDCSIKGVYGRKSKYHWKQPDIPTDVKEMIHTFAKKHNIKKLLQ